MLGGLMNMVQGKQGLDISVPIPKDEVVTSDALEKAKESSPEKEKTDDANSSSSPTKTSSEEKPEFDVDDDVALTFPQRLMEILDNEDNSEVIAWLPHGRGFVIYRKKAFEQKILPKYFNKQSKYSSFTRKLNRWGFCRVTRGAESGSYYHRLFTRGGHRLISQMSCQSSNRGGDSNRALQASRAAAALKNATALNIPGLSPILDFTAAPGVFGSPNQLFPNASLQTMAAADHTAILQQQQQLLQAQAQQQQLLQQELLRRALEQQQQQQQQQMLLAGGLLPPAAGGGMAGGMPVPAPAFAPVTGLDPNQLMLGGGVGALAGNGGGGAGAALLGVGNDELGNSNRSGNSNPSHTSGR